MQLAHTHALDAAALRAARELLEGVFPGELAEEDWEHALGGVHALAYDGGELVGHASVVMRRMLHGGRALRCGYVEGVGVRADRRRRGIGTALMTALGEVIRGAYDLGALGTTDEARRLYERCGWQLWRGRLSALTPDGVVPTPAEEGGVYVLPGAVPLDRDGELVCDWRDGDLW